MITKNGIHYSIPSEGITSINAIDENSCEVFRVDGSSQVWPLSFKEVMKELSCKKESGYDFSKKETPVMLVEDLARAIKAFVAITGDNGINGLNVSMDNCSLMLHRYTGNQLDYDNPANSNDNE